MEDKRIYSNCKKENPNDLNFCKYCGTKISEICPRCWMKKGQPYSCGFEKCPGYKLPLIEKSKS